MTERQLVLGQAKMKPLVAAGMHQFYSMDGDVCALEEMTQIVKEEFPLGNVQLLVDEAHSLGVICENGRGLVSLLGIKK